MPKRTDLRKILLIGSGPIVIGQACEFDYSGTQACKALREEGFEVVLVNSNPATIMTDPEMADRTYIEPLTPEVVAKIIARERPQALLPTLGGQTGLNLAVALAEDGTLARFGVELIGAKLEAIRKAEDRDLFKQAMQRIGLALPRSRQVRSLDEAREVVRQLGYPVHHSPLLHPGRHRRLHRLQPRGARGRGALGAAALARWARSWSRSPSSAGRSSSSRSCATWPTTSSSSARSRTSIPWASTPAIPITVAPAQTLTDKEYQLMRDAAIAIIRDIGVETGGSNIQFAVNPTRTAAWSSSR